MLRPFLTLLVSLPYETDDDDLTGRFYLLGLWVLFNNRDDDDD
jgi:hypothetical protein